MGQTTLKLPLTYLYRKDLYVWFRNPITFWKKAIHVDVILFFIPADDFWIDIDMSFHLPICSVLLCKSDRRIESFLAVNWQTSSSCSSFSWYHIFFYLCALVMYTTGEEILESGKISPAIVFLFFHYDFTIQASTTKTRSHKCKWKAST